MDNPPELLFLVCLFCSSIGFPLVIGSVKSINSGEAVSKWIERLNFFHSVFDPKEESYYGALRLGLLLSGMGVVSFAMLIDNLFFN